MLPWVAAALAALAAFLLRRVLSALLWQLLAGYALMALSTLFAGMAVTRDARALRVLLMAHGAFFVPCVAMPILGVFSAQAAGSDRSGVVALLFWCAYFIPVGVLSGRYFSRALREGGEA